MSRAVQNVVVVVIDALRRDRLGAYSDRDLTPAIDDLCADGTVFDRAFSCTNTTDPSVTSIHTGRDPSTVVRHHGPFVTEEEKRRAESVVGVPERLQEQGLRTVVTGRTLGRWHSAGFDHYPEETFDRYKRRSVGQWIGAVSPRLRSIAGDVYEGVSGVLSDGGTDEIDEFLDVVDDRPFYGLVHAMDTHVPYSVDETQVERLLAVNDYPDTEFEAFLAAHGDGQYVGDFITEYADESDRAGTIGRWFAKYDAAVRSADRKVERLVSGLREAGLLEETLLIVTSDHGESLDEHGIYFDHHGLYDPQIRVPLVAVGPGIPDARRDEFVQLYDLAPTVLDCLEVDPGGVDPDGRSLRPLLGGSGEWEPRDHVVTQEAHAQSRVSIRTRDFKYIEHRSDEVLERERGGSFACGYCDTVHGERQELFDLRTDPDERDNVVTERPERAEALAERLRAYFGSLETPQTGEERVHYDDEEQVMERLEDLGYR